MGNETKIIISGDSSGAISAVGRLKTELGGLQSIAAKALSFGSALTGTAVVASLVSMTKAVIDQGDALNKMSQKTGMAVEDLSKLQYAADLSGVSAEALQKGLTAMAVGMAEAATGAGPMAEQYNKLGIVVRNNDGTMKSSGAVLAELADKFQQMPDGVDKANLAVDIFGKKLGADMIPLLNLGSAGLKALGDEAASLGLVMGAELAKKSEEFNDNLDRMGKLSRSVGMELASSIIPALNSFMSQLIDAKKAGLGFMEAMAQIGLSNPFKSAADQVADLDKEIAKLKTSTAGLSGKLAAEFGDTTAINAQIDALEKLRAYYKLQADRQTGDGVQSAEQLAAKRVIIEGKLQSKLAELAQLRGIAEGKVSADILDADDKRTAAQIKNAEKVRDALSAAWKSALKDAESAGQAAAALFDQAAKTRASGADSAADKRRSALSPEDQQASIQKDFNTAASAAENAAAQARFAEMFGRTLNAATLAKEAERAAERAAKLADKIDDPEMGARAIEQAADIQAKLLEAQARQKQADQAAYQKQAEITAAKVTELDAMITGLQAKAAAIKVEADIAAAQGALTTLQGQLDALKDKTITVTVNTTSPDGVAAASTPATPSSGYALGGYTGPGGKWQPAGIVHAGEFVHRQEVVRQPGALAFLARFNQIGMVALRRNGYANGGLVNNLTMPSLKAQTSAATYSGPNATFNLPSGESFQSYVEPNVMTQLTTICQRQALKKGRRK